MGQSFSSFDASHWQFLNNARDYNTLYKKSVELTAAVTFLFLLPTIFTLGPYANVDFFVCQTLAVSAQLNYKLNNEIHSSRSYAQEAKDLQLKLSDELKATKAKVETGAEELRS